MNTTNNPVAILRFTKKTVTISAIQWTGENLREVIAFTDGRPPNGRDDFASMKWDEYCDLVASEGLKIFTLEGKMNADVGDWIIRGVKGEHYPCKPDIFAMTYEAERAANQPAGERLPCPKCVGTITKADDPCAYCGGVGYCGPVIEAPPAPVQAAPDAKQQGILLAGLQALCVSADQEWTRQGGKLSEFDKGWFMGQLQSIDFYTPAEKEAVYKCREYIEKLSAAPVLSLYELQRNAAEGAISSEFESMFGAAPAAPERTIEAGELPPKRGDCTDECDYQQKLQGYRARQSPPTVTGTSDEKPSDPIRHIITGVREFYLGMLSKHLPMEAFDVARSDDATMVAYQGVAQLFLELVDSVIDARSPVAAAPDLSARDAALEEAYRAADAIMPLDNECNHRDPVKVRNDILNAINRLIGKPRAAPESAEPSAVQDAEDAARVMEMELALYRDVYGAKAPSEALVDVIDERQRQIDTKGWTPQHDDEHPCGEIAAFAAVYAMPPAARDWLCVAHMGYGDTLGEALCPEDWAPKFGDRRRELVKASALIIAEIERLDRATSSAAKGVSDGN